MGKFIGLKSVAVSVWFSGLLALARTKWYHRQWCLAPEVLPAPGSETSDHRFLRDRAKQAVVALVMIGLQFMM